MINIAAILRDEASQDAFVSPVALILRGGREWAVSESGVWFMPGTFMVLTPEQAEAIQHAEARASGIL